VTESETKTKEEKTDIALDFLGNSLSVGDFVAYTYSDSSHLCLGRITGLTPKKIKVDSVNLSGNEYANWRRGNKNYTDLRESRSLILVARVGNMNTSEIADLPISWLAKMIKPA